MTFADFIASLVTQAATIFSSVVRASLLGGCGILLGWSIRVVCGRRLAPALRLVLWTPAFLLLLMPRLPDLGFGFAPPHAPAWTASPPIVERPSHAIEEPPFALANSDPAPTMEAGTALTWQEAAALLWMLVMVAMSGWWIVVHQRWWRQVWRQSLPVPTSVADLFAECCRDVGLRRMPRLVVTRALANPAVSGLLRSTVLIPAGMETSLPGAELRHVLLHEAAHVRRQDLRWHMVSLAVVVLHWFNPLVWLAVRLMRADREAACDAMVLSVIPGDAREAYGTTLLRIQERLAQLMTPRSRLGTLGSADVLRQRILDIVHHGRRSSRLGVAALVMGTACAGLVAMLGAEPAKESRPAALSDNEDPASGKGAVFGASLLCGSSDPSTLETLIESQMTALKSPEWRQKVEERLRLQQPEVAATPVALDVSRKSGSSVVALTTSASDADAARRWLDALLDEVTANRKKVEEAERGAVRASPEFKKLSEKENQLAQLVEEQKAAEGDKAPAARVAELKEKLEAERKAYRELKAALDVAVPTFHVVIFKRTGRLIAPNAAGKNGQQPQVPPSPSAQASPPNGSPVSRARIALEPLPREMEPRHVEELCGSQIEMLRSGTMRKKVAARLEKLHPEITPVPVTVTASRVPDTSQVSIVAWGTSEPYVQYYLDGLLEEMAALRKDAFRKTIHGTMEKVNEEIVFRERRMMDAREKYRLASSQKAPQEKMDKLKAELQRAHEDYQAWLKTAERLRQPIAASQPFIELKILERPIVSQRKETKEPRKP
jgi:beta-lactamase regulating signal transducer with metallopeptidase domain